MTNDKRNEERELEKYRVLESRVTSELSKRDPKYEAQFEKQNLDYTQSRAFPGEQY
ncbi:MAG: hypothetical protein Q7S27_02960 [Nanoarchaeota archaeon]|nr:hypothetical protein [Nanoarchaeota archaeon]